MASSFTLVGSLLSIASSQCYWNVFNPDDGSYSVLNLTALQGVKLNITDTDQPYPGHYLYSICENNERCNGENVMTKKTSPVDSSACYVIGRWDHTKVPEYDNSGLGGWRFQYDNGADDCGGLRRTWSPRFVCDPAVKYSFEHVYEVPNTCFYMVDIRTRFACPDWTTTTTAAPDGECIFKSENGNHILNMTGIKSQLLMKADENTGWLYYMYTPCANAATCNSNQTVMAYVYDGMNFECKQYLAIWEGGYIEPNYIEGAGIWQFTYTNGQPCNGGESEFNVLWFCDKTATSPKVIQAKEIETCVYQMMINSNLACG